MADTALTPFDGGTFGSRTTPDMAAQLHRVAAAAREALLDLAAEFFKADRASLTVADGKITRADTKESVTFGQLTKGQKLVKPVSDDAQRHARRTEWKIAGTSVPQGRWPRLRHRQAQIHVRPQAPRHAATARFSVPRRSTRRWLRSTRARPRPCRASWWCTMATFIGVAAPDVLTATRPSRRSRPSGRPSRSHPARSFRRSEEDPRRPAAVAAEDAAAAVATPTAARSTTDSPRRDHKLQTRYTIAYIAHAPLEPRAAVAEWNDGKLTVWTGTQRPFGVRGDLAQAFGLAEDQVHVIVPDTGSGYGGKHTGEAAIEAARLAKGGRQAGQARLDARGGIHVGVFSSRRRHRNRERACAPTARSPRGNSTTTTPAAPHSHALRMCPHQRSRIPQARARRCDRAPIAGSPRPRTSSRARSTWTNSPALVKIDPLEFRLKNLKDARLRAVLEAAAKALRLGQGEARRRTTDSASPAARRKASYVAACAESRGRLAERQREGRPRRRRLRMRRHRQPGSSQELRSKAPPSWASAARSSKPSISTMAKS